MVERQRPKLYIEGSLPFRSSSCKMARSKSTRTKQTAKRGRLAKSAMRPPLVGIRLTPAMKDALDEVAFEWQTTRSAVMRELIAHALKSPPKRNR